MGYFDRKCICFSQAHITKETILFEKQKIPACKQKMSQRIFRIQRRKLCLSIEWAILLRNVRLYSDTHIIKQLTDR